MPKYPGEPRESNYRVKWTKFAFCYQIDFRVKPEVGSPTWAEDRWEEIGSSSTLIGAAWIIWKHRHFYQKFGGAKYYD